MTPLSLAIIARDEVDRIERTIQSASWADEILVLDSGSTDGTPELAERLGARVVRTDWPGFVAQKNRALALCRNRWVLCLDADERLDEAAAQAIRGALEGTPTVSGFALRRQTWWMGAPMQHGSWGREWKLRLVDRERARWQGIDPHDQLVSDGQTARLPGLLVHQPYRSLGDHLATIDRYTELSARTLYDRGRRTHAWDLLLRPPLHFVAELLLRFGWLDGVRGLAVAGLGSTYVLLKYTRLWLLERGGPPAAGEGS